MAVPLLKEMVTVTGSLITELVAPAYAAVSMASPAFPSDSEALVSPKDSSIAELLSSIPRPAPRTDRVEELTVTSPPCTRIVSASSPSATASSFTTRVKVAVPVCCPAAMGTPSAYPTGVPGCFAG